MPLLDLQQLKKSYGGAPALLRGDLQLRAGEVHALMGENGAGKSTLIRILAGVVSADGGEIRIKDQKVAINSSADARRFGIRFIHQELNIVPQLSVAENIFLGAAMPRRLGCLIDWAALNKRAAAALATLQISHINPATKMARLGTGDRMLVKIASAFLADDGAEPLIHVMDEPTAALTGDESARLFAVIARLKESGCAILYVSHRMDEVMQIADRVTVMRDGETKATMPIAETSQTEIIALMTGRQMDNAFPPRLAPKGSDTALSVKALAGAGVQNLDFTVARGEILGLAGLAGSGQSAVLDLLMGAARRNGGEILLYGKPVINRSPAEAWSNGFAAVPRERRADGLALSRSITDNASLPHLNALSRLGIFASRRGETEATTALAGQVRLKAQGMSQVTRTLSGGNQQKVVFARAIAEAPAVLLLDEPTRGVDVGAKYDIYQLIRELTAKGTSVILASTDLPELIGMADRLLVLKDGRLSADIDTEGLDQPQLLTLCYGSAPASFPRKQA